ncbi:D-2-hydroxyacid dehydrogenase [Aurantimonas sp. 22II-16-19i]|uniref:D-2-hydroxyacid dehydrogenase n=1 Tax=Aurantimonas sp. 22II-16-19i TaxID=1317114 RepID=UPI0009F7A227|nr:D-2-hydroxyacid dehydrogenase [Aurantimonas sp. 22II-16-19i]ORE98543.1 D-isomer specific 2-hydroxyacid dehydrogenase NAD-binding protein [Aurantimonas sp. 22II-16-19i]
MTRIVFLDRETIGPDIELTRPSAEHEWVEYASTRPEDVAERLQGATIAVTNKVPIRRDSLEKLTDLKFVTVAATGYDVIDIEAFRERGIPVSNVRGYAENTVPDHAMAMILALSRSLPGYRQDVIDGAWQKSGQFCFFNHPIFDLAGRKLGILGEGVIGQGVAKRAAAFGMSVMFAAHKGVSGMGPLYTPFDEVIETADVLTLHAPLTPQTKNMIAMPEFRRMKKKPLIVNTSRGGLVDEADLVQALEEGLIAGLGFDVLTREPPAPDNPLLKVLSRPNVIVTPHVAWASNEAQSEVWRQVVDSIDRFVAGEPVRRVV